jgi:hypothetical protein
VPPTLSANSIAARTIASLKPDQFERLIALLGNIDQAPYRVPQRHLIAFADPTGDTAADNVDRSRPGVSEWSTPA